MPATAAITDLTGLAMWDKRFLALSEDVPEATQLALAREGVDSPGLLMDLARNPALTETTQLELARNPSEGVRGALVGNPSLTRAAQELLGRDPREHWAMQRWSELTLTEQELALRGMKLERMRLAANMSLDESAQEALSRDDDAQVRNTLARNPQLVPALQERLSCDANEGVRIELARNVRLCPRIQLELARDGSPDIHYALATNPGLKLSADLPVSFFEASGRTQRMLEQALTDTDPQVRSVLEPGFAGTLGELLTALRSFA